MTIHYDPARQYDPARRYEPAGRPRPDRRSLVETLHVVGLPVAAVGLTIAFLYAVSGLVSRMS